MSFKIQDFTDQILLVSLIHKWYPSRATELNSIAAALASDTATRSTELTAAVLGLRPGHASHTRFTNDVLLIVNAGKAGNLTPVAMGNAITAELSKIFAPVNTSAPAISGTGTVGQTLSCTQGNWTYVPTSYAYQWRRGAANIAGATAATHVLVAADSGTSLTCQVTATNAAGSTLAPLSNAIACA
jgi:hypothetical protein